MANASVFNQNKTNSPPATAATVADEKLARKKAMYACCKKGAKFLASTLGLSIIVAVYAVAGAFIFQILEQTNEKEECIQAS